MKMPKQEKTISVVLVNSFQMNVQWFKSVDPSKRFGKYSFIQIALLKLRPPIQNFDNKFGLFADAVQACNAP